MNQPIRRIGISKLATVSEIQRSQGPPVALKEFNRQSLTPLQHERIFAAAQRWQRLEIPGIVPFIEVLPSENQIVMDLYDRSAAMRLSDGPSDPRLVLHAMRGMLLALAQLHEHGWLHLNLKPTNVFFDPQGRALLSDGLLASAGQTGELPPAMNQKYVSPEYANGAFGPLSVATDLYSVGFLALELLAGDRFNRSFQGLHDSVGDDDPAWLQWHASSLDAPHATVFAKSCPHELTSVIMRLLSKAPSARFSSARAALDELPRDISASAKIRSAGRDQPEVGDLQREAFATHVVQRPAMGIVLAIASGPRAGEMIGTNDKELLIGYDHDCTLRFSKELYPHPGGKVLLRRGTEGWYALRVSGDAAFVNQTQLEERAALRSGDIVRLSPRGPDVQFTMQSGGVAIRTLVDRFLPTQPKLSDERTKQPVGAEARSTAAAGLAQASQPRWAGSFPEASPAGSVPRASEATKPSGSPADGSTFIYESASQPGATVWRRLSPRYWERNVRDFVIGILGGLLAMVVIISIATFMTNRRSDSSQTPDETTQRPVAPDPVDRPADLPDQAPPENSETRQD